MRGRDTVTKAAELGKRIGNNSRQRIWEVNAEFFYLQTSRMHLWDLKSLQKVYVSLISSGVITLKLETGRV